MAKKKNADGVHMPTPTDKIILEDTMLVGWLQDKDRLVKEGREVSKKLDEVMKGIVEYEEKEKALTEKVVPQKLIDEGNALRDKINEEVKELEKIGNAIREEKLKAIPEEMKTAHLALSGEREKLEEERNKIALKVQKIKDRLVPRLQKLCVKHLGEYEDLMTADLDSTGEHVVVQKFSHLQEWKRAYAERAKKVSDAR